MPDLDQIDTVFELDFGFANSSQNQLQKRIYKRNLNNLIIYLTRNYRTQKMVFEYRISHINCHIGGG